MNKPAIVVACALLSAPAVTAAGLLGAVAVLSRSSSAGNGEIPASVPGLHQQLLTAYVQAAAKTAKVAPNCTGTRWQILAGIAQIESNNAAGRSIDQAGKVTPPIIGPVLDGSGAGGNHTAILDTDNGQWDANTRYDAAVGVLQFIPSSWRTYGRDGNGDRVLDPHNVFDNALGAVVHLCGTGRRDLNHAETLGQALYGYNQSWSYVDKVLDAIASFDAITPTDLKLPTGSGSGAVIVAAAKRRIGTPYSWGGGGPRGPTRGICCSPNGSDGRRVVGFDCSGLSGYAAAQIGITIPGTAAAQATVGQQIPRSAGLGVLRPGDLVFFGFLPEARAGIHHVGIYVGNGQMINAPRPGKKVRIEPMWMDEYAGAVRLA